LRAGKGYGSPTGQRRRLIGLVERVRGGRLRRATGGSIVLRGCGALNLLCLESPRSRIALATLLVLSLLRDRSSLHSKPLKLQPLLPLDALKRLAHLEGAVDVVRFQVGRFAKVGSGFILAAHPQVRQATKIVRPRVLAAGLDRTGEIGMGVAQITRKISVHAAAIELVGDDVVLGTCGGWRKQRRRQPQ
jgi:hypothetical protein